MSVAPSGRIGEIAGFPVAIVYNGRLHGAQIFVTFTIARLVYLQIVPFLLMLLPFSCHPTFLGMKRV